MPHANLHTDLQFGLTARDMATIQGIFSVYPDVREVWIFGSRANGTYKPGSDIDLAIVNEGVAHDMLRRIVADFEESSLPYFVDVIHLPALKNKDLAAEINHNGRSIYTASPGIDHVTSPDAG
jgi:predicted nucleotidyltransferase